MVSLTRRQGLRLLAAAPVASLAVASTGCQADEPLPVPTPGKVTPSAPSSGNPFGVPRGSAVELLADSRYPTDWLDDLATSLAAGPQQLALASSTTSQLAQQLGGRLTAGTPPDVVLNTGSDAIGIGQNLDHLADLGPVLDSAAGGGRSVRETLRAGTVRPGSDGVVRGIDYVWGVHGLWYSASLFRQFGWKPPATCDELLSLGAMARSQDKYLFAWGRDTATWFQRLAISAAVRQGGESVRAALDTLQPACWSHTAVQAALQCLHTCVQEGFVRPDGSSRSWSQVQGSWGSDGQVLLLPAGGWIVSQTTPAKSFELALAPDPSVTTGAALPATALHAGPVDTLLVPTDARNPAGAQEMVRQMLTRARATAFAVTNQVATVVSDALPASPGPGLKLQLDALARAGKDTYSWRFVDHYGTNHDHQALWNAFLEGDMDVATLTRESQRITDLVAADSSQVRFPS